MTQFRKKPVVITAITFDQLVAHGIATGGNVVNGMPWSFSYAGHPVTHENDSCYLIPTLEGIMKMGRDDMLITGVKGEIYPCKRDIFEATYDPAPMLADGTAADPEKFGVVVIDVLPVVDPGPDSLEREIQAKAGTRWEQGKAPRLTMDEVNAQIMGETYTVLPSGRVTVCELTLKNGFTVRGESAVVFIENNVPQTGREIARKNAVDQIWPLLGYQLREDWTHPVLTEADAAADLAGTPRPDNPTAESADFLANVKACDLSGDAPCEACQ